MISSSRTSSGRTRASWRLRTSKGSCQRRGPRRRKKQSISTKILLDSLTITTKAKHIRSNIIIRTYNRKWISRWIISNHRDRERELRKIREANCHSLKWSISHRTIKLARLIKREKRLLRIIGIAVEWNF